MRPITAVHFGPGRLGLGLVIDVLLQTRRYDVYLIGAPDRPRQEQRTYYLRFTDPAVGVRQRVVTWAGNPRSMSDVPEVLLARLRSDEPVLVTSALGENNVAEAYERIHGVLQLRPPLASTVLLVCENEPHTIYADLETSNPHVEVRRCVVDRICALDERPSAEPGRRILVHDVSLWVIPHACGDGSAAADVWPPLDGLRGAEDVLMLDGDADAYKHRKLWVVNGIHMILATIARRAGVDVLPLTGERQRQFRNAAEPLAMAMLQAAECAYGLPVDEHFAGERVRAFCEAPDSATRVLSGRYMRADLRPYVKRLDSRVAAAARTAHEHGLDTEPFLWAFEEVVQAIGESDSFLDVTVVDPETRKLKRNAAPPAISAAVDAEVESVFAAALREWAPATDVEVLTRRVRSALDTWRQD